MYNEGYMCLAFHQLSDLTRKCTWKLQSKPADHEWTRIAPFQQQKHVLPDPSRHIYLKCVL